MLYEQIGYTMEVVHMIKIRPEFKQLLGMIVASKSVGVFVATCGINSIWRQVLEREFPGSNIAVIGSNSTRNGYVVTPETKANLVTILQDNHGIHVCAIGDSLVDVGMLTKADMSFVVVGPEHGRSKSVESALLTPSKRMDFVPDRFCSPLIQPPD